MWYRINETLQIWSSHRPLQEVLKEFDSYKNSDCQGNKTEKYGKSFKMFKIVQNHKGYQILKVQFYPIDVYKISWNCCTRVTSCTQSSLSSENFKYLLVLNHMVLGYQIWHVTSSNTCRPSLGSKFALAMRSEVLLWPSMENIVQMCLKFVTAQYIHLRASWVIKRHHKPLVLLFSQMLSSKKSFLLFPKCFQDISPAR